MAIGALGRLVFETSDSRILTFSGVSREITSRWADHETIGTKPQSEFLGPGLQSLTFEITVSASLGVRPMEMLREIERMVERGTAHYFVIGNRPVGDAPFRITGSSEAWGHIYNGGRLASAKISITLEEYA